MESNIDGIKINNININSKHKKEENKKEIITPKTIEAKSSDAFNSYGKAFVGMSFKKNIKNSSKINLPETTIDERRKLLSEVKFINSQGEEELVFQKKFAKDIANIDNNLILDNDFIQRAIEIAQLSYTNLFGKEQRLFADFSNIVDIAKDEENFKRAIELSKITYTDKNNEEQKMFTYGMHLAEIAKNEEIFKRTAELTKISYTDENGKEEKIYTNAFDIATITQDKETYDRTIELSKITYTDKNGKKQKVFKNTYNISVIARNKDIILDNDFKERIIELSKITYINSDKKEERIFEYIPISDIVQIIENKEMFDRAIKLTKMEYVNHFEKKERILNGSDIVKLAKNKEIYEKVVENSENIEIQRAKVLKYPELYVNGSYETQEEAFYNIQYFFNENYINLAMLYSAVDKETINDILRMRFSNAQDYLDIVSKFNLEDLKLLKDLSLSNNTNNKPITPSQKIDFIDLIQAYKDCGLDTLRIEAMIKEKKIDIDQLNIDLLYGLLKKCGFSNDEISKIPIDKLTSWNKKYIHKLALEINNSNFLPEHNKQVFINLFKISNLNIDFKSYIQNDSNIYGITNATTKKMYKDLGLNYRAWLYPSKNNEVQFQSKDKNIEQLSQITNQIEEDIETLRMTPAKDFIDKQYSKYIKNNKFIIPTEFAANKAKLTEFCTNLLKQLEPIFKRAKSNINNLAKKNNAQTTLTIQNHLTQRLSDIKQINNTKSSKEFDLTIKMWDRIPQKDLFQGNYSTCCIGMGNGNGCAMAHYLFDSVFNMIEIVDNTTKNTIGNALCYFVKDSNGIPVLVIDNIEIKNSEKPSTEIGISLRNAITEYASNVAKEVTNRDDTEIFISPNYNDIPIEDLTAKEETVSLLGDTDCKSIYMDLYTKTAEWTDKKNYTQSVKLLKLK